MNKKYIILISIFLLIAILLYNLVKFNISTENHVLVISENESASTVINNLSKNTSSNKILLQLLFKLSGADKKLKPGSYKLESVNNIFEMINVLISNELYIEKNGQVIKDEYIKFTIIEGWNIYDISASISENEKLSIDYDLFINKCYDMIFIQNLDLFENIYSLEGMLYPETYYLLSSYNEEDVLRVFINEFKKQIEILNIDNRKLYDKMILASIIESESREYTEMPNISSVFHNRLKENMRLDADPTIIYCMQLDDVKSNYMNFLGSSNSVNLFLEYKKSDCKYNTYLHFGLPPSPICNPGKEAILSALNPNITNYKYFVSDGNGKHIFSQNLREHINNINELRNLK